MHSQMHWEGYSLPASQLPYAIPVHPLHPYGYSDGMGMGMEAAFQVACLNPAATLSIHEKLFRCTVS